MHNKKYAPSRNFETIFVFFKDENAFLGLIQELPKKGVRLSSKKKIPFKKGSILNPS
jgi:hypothetical protein